MKPALDLSSVRALLQRGINAGYWTLEQLDNPPACYDKELREARKSEYFGPTYVPPTPYRNLLRDYSAPEAVQPISPRDFDVAAAARPNEGQHNVDLLPQQWPPVPCVSDQPDLSSDQDAASDRADHGHPRHVGTTREPSSPNAGSNGPAALEPQPAPWPAGAAPW